MLQVPGAKEEWGVAGGGEMGAVTEEESDRQMKQEAPEESAPSSAAAPGLATPGPTREVKGFPAVSASNTTAH